MVDVHTKAQRRYNMSRIRSSGTNPELKIKKLMQALGLAYQPKGIMGRPDFADKKRKIAVFVDGCFWHGCPKHGNLPKSNIFFWRKKIQTNRVRDRKVNCELKKLGWKVIRIWECKL
jgi:DNA mismatch endonuclease (patch repair protein)